MMNISQESMPRELPTEETNSLVNTPEMEGYKQTKLGWIPVDWEVKLLGEFFEFKNGLNKGKEFFGYGTPIINYMDVNKKDSLRLDDIKGKVSLSESEIQRFNIKKGDVFFTRTSETIDEIAYSTVLIEDVKEGVFSGFVLRARPRKLGELDINFTRYCFSTHIARKEIISKSTFTTRALTNGRFLSDVNLLIPPLPEQQKIAQILSTWDKAIALQEKLITEKQALKKGLMQELLTGKKRFPGFDEEWEEVKIKEIATTFSGGTPSSKKKEYYNGNIPWLKSGELNKGIIEKTEGYISELGLENSSAKIVEVDTILIAMYGATAGVCAITKIQGAINQAVLAINLTEEDDNFFIYQLLRMKMPNIVHRMVQGGQPNLSGGIVNSVKLKLPKTKEQQKIAAVLSNFDTELEHLEDHKNALIAQKRGLMQQLLTGEKRVEITDYEKRKN